MCAILDANLLGEVFSARPQPAAGQFFDWMQMLRCRVVVGGKVRIELERNESFRRWAGDALRDGWLRNVDDELVDEQARRLLDAGLCRSDDEHIIALAQMSGARLLFSQDEDLRADFIDNAFMSPRGRLLPLGTTRNARRSRQRILNEPDLCLQRRA